MSIFPTSRITSRDIFTFFFSSSLSFSLQISCFSSLPFSFNISFRVYSIFLWYLILFRKSTINFVDSSDRRASRFISTYLIYCCWMYFSCSCYLLCCSAISPVSFLSLYSISRFIYSFSWLTRSAKCSFVFWTSSFIALTSLCREALVSKA